MARRGKHIDKRIDESGQDAFLDIVANLVGILIILVMVLGVRAKDALVEASATVDSPPPEALEAIDVETPRAKAVQIEADVRRMADEIKRISQTAKNKLVERNRIQLLVTAAEREIENYRQQLDETQRKDFDLRRDVISAKSQLDKLRQQRQALETLAANVNVIEHLPTPMAKTVFGREEHYRLEGGRLAFVPWNELVERLKTEAPEKVWKLKDATRTTETIGPLQGFRMKYTLHRTEHPLQTRVGTAVQRKIELAQFVLIPVSDKLGEPVDVALAENSDFLARIRQLDPQRTTVTVWTYPDSFEDFRRVKRRLFDLGFLSAGRPLPEGFPIGGAPQGTRSAAQ